ncbi:MAG: trigger factor [Buchnera aphidicola (Meitanaphis microgallis)]
MNLEIKKNKNLFRSINITIPHNIIQKSIKTEIIKLNNTIQINGFRKGKIPLNILKKNYEDKILENTLKKLTKQYFLEKIHKEKLRIAGTPTFILNKYEKNQDLSYSIKFEIYPEFILNTKPFTVHIPVIDITENDILKTIHNYFQQHNWVESNHTIKLHDKVAISCYITNNSENNLYKKKLYDFQFIIGNNEILPEIKKKLLIHKVNESFFTNITFSQHHCDKHIAGKTLKIKITIKKVQELEEKLLKEHNTNKLHLNKQENETIKTMLKTQAKKITKNYIKSQIINNLIKSNPINVPSILIQNVFLILQQKIKNMYIKDNENIFKTIYQENLTIKAHNQVAITIILQKYIQDNFLKPNIKEIQSLIKKSATLHNNTNNLIQLYNNNESIKHYFNNTNLEKQAIDKILEKSIKNEKKYNFYEAINELNHIN